MNAFTKYHLLVSLMMFWILPLMAQKGVEDNSQYGHGEDSIRCIMNLSLYREFVKQGEVAYKDAMGSWKIVFSECPSATQNIYIDGVKLYNALIDNEEDPARKAQLMESFTEIASPGKVFLEVMVFSAFRLVSFSYITPRVNPNFSEILCSYCRPRLIRKSLKTARSSMIF